MDDTTKAMIGMIAMGVLMVVGAWAQHTERISHAEHANILDSFFAMWPSGLVFIVFGILGLAGLEGPAGLFLLSFGTVGALIYIL